VTQLESDLRALYKSGFFENIRIEDRDGDVGKIVTYILKENPLIHSVEFLGNRSFTEFDFFSACQKKKLTPPAAMAFYDRQRIQETERIIKELMIRNGKARGTVQTEIERVPPSEVRIRFTINEEGEARP